MSEAASPGGAAPGQDPRGASRWWPVVLIGVVGCVAAIGFATTMGSGRPAPAAGAGADPIPSEADLRVLLGQPDAVARGRSLYQTHCRVCHGEQGEGLVGPNLRDDHWLKGSAMRDIARSIREGNPMKGMPVFASMPGVAASDIAALTAYVVTLKSAYGGRDKAPEGPSRPIGYWPPPPGGSP